MAAYAGAWFKPPCGMTATPGRMRRNRCWRSVFRSYSIALTMSSTTFLASPKTIIVLSM